MYHLCYITDYCPFCGSPRTGFCVKGNSLRQSAVNTALKMGAYIRNVPLILYEHNTYCVDCNAMWDSDIKLIFLSQKDYDDLLVTKGINEAKKKCGAYFQQIKIRQDEKSSKKKGMERVKRLLKKIARFYLG